MHLLPLLALMIAIPSLDSWASPEACPACDPADPFVPGQSAILPSGRWKGECQDICRRRSAALLPKAMSQRIDDRSQADELLVANVAHLRQFYIARILPRSLARVVVQIEEDPGSSFAGAGEQVTAHVQLRFDFDDWVILIPQREPFPGQHPLWCEFPNIAVKSLVFSVESSGPPGQKFSLLRGLTDFAAVYRVTSLSDRYESMVVKQKRHVEQLALNLDRAQLQRILHQALALATSRGMQTMYNTLTRNCASELLSVLDDALDLRSRNPLWKITGMIHHALRARGLVSSDSQIPDLFLGATPEVRVVP